MTIFNCKREGDPVRDAVKPVLEVMLKGARQEDVTAALQKAQKELVLGCKGCWASIEDDVLWVHAYVEAEKKLLEEIEREAGKASEISAMCFLHKAAGIAIADETAVAFYSDVLIPTLEKPENKKPEKWLTYTVGENEAPIVKVWLNGDALVSAPALAVDPLYKCLFAPDRTDCVYVHIGYPGRATELASHVGPAGCYLLLKNHDAFGKIPPCLVFHLRSFVQTLATAQLSVLATHLRQREASKVEELKKYESMYNQLLSPLRSLTEAVRRTQEDAHEIAAIIHDPLDVLLGRQSAIAELFIQDNIVEVPPFGTEVKIAHNPSQYTNANDAAGVAAELLHRLIPKLAENLKATSSHELLRLMVNRLAKWSRDQTNAYSKFCVAFQRFLDPKSWELGEDVRNHSEWSELAECLRGDRWRPVAIEFLSTAKERFFRLYKPDEADEALSWEVMRAYLCTIYATNGKFLSPPASLDIGEIAPEKANPLNTHGHLVAFIGRVIAQHVVHNELNADDINFWSCKKGVTTTFAVTSKEPWLSNCEQFVRFLKEQIGHREVGIRAVREFGDFKRPFVDLIQRIPVGVHAAACSDESSVRLGISKLVFEFCGHEFKMVTNGEVVS